MTHSDPSNLDISSNQPAPGGSNSAADSGIRASIPALPAQTQMEPPSQHTTTSVLVVDDSQINIDLVQNYLAQMKLSYSAATNGPDAIEMAKKLQPSLILLDVMMPGMNGLEVCRILKNDPVTSAIPIIFLSARKQTDQKVQGMAVGAVDYITKHFPPSALEIRSLQLAIVLRNTLQRSRTLSPEL